MILALKITGILAACVASATLYRMGGADGYNTKFRDFGVPTCVVMVLMIMGFFNWMFIPIFGLTFAAMTTYHKWLGRLVGRKDNEVHWESWAMTGLAYSMALIPYAWTTGHWTGFFVRTAVCTVLTAGWSSLVGNAKWEELGRGFIVTATLPLLLID